MNKPQIRAKPGSSAHRDRTTGAAMSYKIVATKEDQTMRSVRQSLLITAAKARVWASEGWDVVVTDGEERTLDPADFEKLFELKQVTALTAGVTAAFRTSMRLTCAILVHAATRCLSKTRFTWTACHSPPRAVLSPRAFNVSAIPFSV